jgi:hypothetical protein
LGILLTLADRKIFVARMNVTVSDVMDRNIFILAEVNVREMDLTADGLNKVNAQ